MTEDPHDLERFVLAQAPIYSNALEELQAGSKESHWMWFIFPQILGLGTTNMAIDYAISDLSEAKAYLAHPVLGQRLEECSQALLALEGLTLSQIMSFPDDLKFCSSMTLFYSAAPDNELFALALDKYCHGEPDSKTLEILSNQSN